MAFSVAFVTGCAAQTAEGGDPATADGTEPATTAEADLSAKKTKKKTGQASGLPSGSGCHHDAGAPKLSCDQVVAAAFPTEGDYPGVKKSVSAEVQTCCAELLEPGDGGSLAAHRWDCCANLPADAGQSLLIACTPWGPPVPPAMKRRARQLTAAPTLQAVA